MSQLSLEWNVTFFGGQVWNVSVLWKLLPCTWKDRKRPYVAYMPCSNNVFSYLSILYIIRSCFPVLSAVCGPASEGNLVTMDACTENTKLAALRPW